MRYQNKEIARKIVSLLPNQKLGDVVDVLDTMTKVILDSLKEGDEVMFRGFGIFKAKPRKGYVITNNQIASHHGEKIVVPDLKKIVFYASSSLRATIRNEWMK